MILRTILFFILLYFLVKVLSRLFLPSDQKRNARRSKSAFEVFYTTMKKHAESQQRQQQNRRPDSLKDRLDQIEEAEFEEVKEEEEQNEQPKKE